MFKTITEAVDTLKLGYKEAREVLGEEVQEWFRQKYLLQKTPIKDKIYTSPSFIPKGKIYFGVYDFNGKSKKGFYDVYPIVFHIDSTVYKNIDSKLGGINLNYYDNVKRAVFIDAVSTFFVNYIEENKKRLEVQDLMQYSVDGMNDFLNGYIGEMGFRYKKNLESYIWSQFRPTTVLPIDYEDWKWLPLLTPTGVNGQSLSKIQSNSY
jgi:hypothetical protein